MSNNNSTHAMLASYNSQGNSKHADRSRMSDEKKKSLSCYVSVAALDDLIETVIIAIRVGQDNPKLSDIYSQQFASIEKLFKESQASSKNEESSEEMLRVYLEKINELDEICKTTKDENIRLAIARFISESETIIHPAKWSENHGVRESRPLTAQNNQEVLSERETDMRRRSITEKAYKFFINIFGVGILTLFGLSVSGIASWGMTVPSMIVIISAMLVLGGIYARNHPQELTTIK